MTVSVYFMSLYCNMVYGCKHILFPSALRMSSWT